MVIQGRIRPPPAAVDSVATAAETPRDRGPELAVDLAAIQANYRAARTLHTGRTLSAVVKSDAYGLGLERVAAALEAVGCDTFWVNDLEEAARLRAVLPDATVYALFGLGPDSPADFAALALLPVLGSLAEVRRCIEEAGQAGQPMPVAVQLDTGLGRLGLTGADVDLLSGHADWLDALDIRCWVSHLAAFDLPDADSNRAQRQALADWIGRLRPAPVSLASSAGLFMGRDWHFDIARIGSALYGIQTSAHWQAGLTPCYRLTAPVLRVAELPAGSTVGYRGVTRLGRPSRIATLELGYANGLPPAFVAGGEARIDGHPAPFVGGLSMNLSMLDVTDLPEGAVRPSSRAVVLDGAATIDAAAERIGCAPNVLLTQIGHGTPRRYLAGPAGAVP